MTHSTAKFKGQLLGGEVEVIINIKHINYPTWCKMTDIMYESPIVYGLKKEL